MIVSSIEALARAGRARAPLSATGVRRSWRPDPPRSRRSGTASGCRWPPRTPHHRPDDGSVPARKPAATRPWTAARPELRTRTRACRPLERFDDTGKRRNARDAASVSAYALVRDARRSRQERVATSAPTHTREGLFVEAHLQAGPPDALRRVRRTRRRRLAADAAPHALSAGLRGSRQTTSPASSARNVSDSSSCRRRGRPRRARARRRSAAPRASRRLALAPQLLEPRRAARSYAVGRVEEPPHDELRRDGAVPAVLLQPEDEVVARLAPEPVELRAEAERDRAAGVAAVLAHAEAQVLALPDRRGLDGLAAGDEQGHVGVAEPERRQPVELLRQVERQRRRAGTIASTTVTGREVVVGRARASAWAANAGGEASSCSGPDREPGRGAMAAEALEVRRAGGERRRAGRRRGSSGRSPSSRRPCPRSARPAG